MSPTERGRPITPEPPFRWDVKKREQLGSLVGSGRRIVAESYVSEILVCCARVVAFCGDGDLFFVGHSPDNLFDLLSGIFAGTTWEQRLHPLPVSLRWVGGDDEVTDRRHLLRRYLTRLDLTPQQINGHSRP